MRMFIAASAAAFVLAVAGGASAQTGAGGVSAYANLGYTQVDGGDDTDANFDAVTTRLGARARYFGLEAEASFGVGEESESADGVEIEVRLEHTLAAYLVGYVPAGENLDLFARVGLAHIAFSAEALGESVDADEGALAYGVGAQYFFAGGNGVRADYTRFEIQGNGDGLEGSADTFGIAYVRRF